MRNFKDKIAVNTGAGSGIGQALAIELAKKGATLILSDKNADTLADTQKMVQTFGTDCYTYTVDVSVEKEIADFANKVIKKFHHIDLLFNNAGFALGKIALKDVKMEDFKKIMNVNVYGVIHHTKLFLDILIYRPEAVIVNISSLFGLIGVADQVAYCTSKFVVRGFTESLRMELMDTNVEVYCVHPGGINTNIYKNAIHYEKKASLDAKFQKALERTSPEQAAKVILKHIEQKDEKILIGVDAVLGDRLARTMPVGYSKIIKRMSDYITKN